VRQRKADDKEAFTGLRGAILDAIRRSVGTRPRRWLVVLTLLMGLVAAVATAASPADRTFAKISDAVQSLMSITVPFLGVLLARDLQRVPGVVRISPTLLVEALLAAIIGVFGVLACAATLAIAPAGTAEDPWRHAGTIAMGSVLVQVVAGSVGTGLGLLLRSFVVAFVASIVLPLGLWFALGGVAVLRPAQAWLTPYATVQNLLTGQMNTATWGAMARRTPDLGCGSERHWRGVAEAATTILNSASRDVVLGEEWLVECWTLRSAEARMMSRTRLMGGL